MFPPFIGLFSKHRNVIPEARGPKDLAPERAEACPCSITHQEGGGGGGDLSSKVRGTGHPKGYQIQANWRRLTVWGRAPKLPPLLNSPCLPHRIMNFDSFLTCTRRMGCAQCSKMALYCLMHLILGNILNQRGFPKHDSPRPHRPAADSCP